MSWISRMRGLFGGGPAPELRGSLENPRYSLDDPGVLDALWIDNGTLPPLRPQRAIQTSAVYACVRVISQSVASLPLHTYRRGENGKELADDTDVYQLLHTQPNPYQTAYVFLEQGTAQAALWGNFYAEIQRDMRTGRPLALYPLPAWEVQPELATVDGQLVKKYHIRDQVLDDYQVLHIPALGWDGIRGVSPVALARASITLSLNAEEFAANFAKNGTGLSGVLEHPNKLSKEAAERLRSSWQDVYSGKANAGKTAVLEEGLKFSQLTMPLKDAQFVESRQFQVADVARWFGVPPHKIGDLARSTNNNIEHQGREFLSDTLRPWLRRWEQEINRKLFTPIQRRRFFVRFDVSDVLRGDIKSRYEAYAIARQWGWMSANDVLDAEDLNRIQDGDVYLSPLNMVPADQLDAIEDKLESAGSEPADQDEQPAGANGD